MTSISYDEWCCLKLNLLALKQTPASSQVVSVKSAFILLKPGFHFASTAASTSARAL